MTSTALVLAAKEFEDAARSRLLWGLTLVLLVVTVPQFHGMTGTSIIDGPVDAVAFFPQTFMNYVAPLAIIAAYRAVVGERESGSLRVLFGHPVTRRDVVVGKVLGRAALVALVLFVGTLGLGAVVFAVYGTLPVGLFAVMATYVVAYGVVWAAVTVGVSAAASSRLQAIAGLLGLFLFFGPFRLWSTVSVPLASLVFGGGPADGIDVLDPGTWPWWYPYVQRVNPMENFEMAREFVAGIAAPSVGSLGGPAVNAFGFGILLTWAIVPLSIGYWRFELADLG